MANPGQAKQIRKALVDAVFWNARSPTVRVSRLFDVTRQTVHHHIRALIADRILTITGSGRSRTYGLLELARREVNLPLSGKLDENDVFNNVVEPLTEDLTTEESFIVRYGFTEMLNNAIDHSAGKQLKVHARVTSGSIQMSIADDGVGIFQKISGKLKLIDARQSLLELGKGKFTTDPKNHTGEGVFFTSRAFDRFSIRSSDLLFTHSARVDDWLVEMETKDFVGTRVTMSLILPSTRRMKEDVFDRFSSGPEEYSFSKTHVPLKLAQYGDEGLVSRSTAKRVLGRVDRFDEVLLDFAGIRQIGQGFADEIFRVFANAFPAIRLTAINANENVTSMIRRAESSRREQSVNKQNGE